jgi:hypothetical protein
MEPTYLQRLSFIKYLFSLGQYQSQQPEPLCAASVLSFHDSVELFLQLVLEKLNIAKKTQGFIDYWDVVEKAELGIRLTQKESMRRLNKARSQLKHHGLLPAKLDIESYKITALNFFKDNCAIIFKVDFDDISLIDIISYERPREQLKKAKENYKKGMIEDSLLNIYHSFNYLLTDYEKSKKIYHRSFFDFGPERFESRKVDYFGHGLESHEINSFIEDVSKSISKMQGVLRILCLGINFKKYVKFKSILPPFKFAIDGTVYCNGKITLNDEDYEFCINFIVESAMKLQEFDFEGNLDI